MLIFGLCRKDTRCGGFSRTSDDLNVSDLMQSSRKTLVFEPNMLEYAENFVADNVEAF